MKDLIRAHISVTLHLLVLALAVSIGAFVAHYTTQNVTRSLEAQLNTHEAYLYELATITDRNGADETIASIIRDCPQRDAYEELLMRLNTLTRKDLVRVQELSSVCGRFYAEKKALMVSKLEHELVMYTDLAALLESINEEFTNAQRVSAWQELVKLEKTRSALLIEQSDIQSKIISLLMTGSTSYSKDVTQLVADAQNIAQTLTSSDQRIDEIREGLKQ